MASYMTFHPEGTMDEYIHSRCMNDASNVANTWNRPHDVAPYLLLTDKERFDILFQELSPTNVER
ncbi:hypothetical protein BDR06DRAFT_1012729 [Suillus hirtellus]|nr:hypothetical protein BDR06DRAFT_1012729 [Suillus hirtellus]